MRFFDLLDRAIDCKKIFENRNRTTPLSLAEVEKLLNKLVYERVTYRDQY